MMIKDEEGNQAPAQRISQQGISLEAGHKEISSKYQHGHDTQAGCETINAIDQVERVDDNNNGQIGHRQRESFRYIVKSKKAIHAVDTDTTEMNDDGCSHHLPDKFLTS